MLGDAAKADDAMQETFVRAARGVARYEPGADVHDWVFSHARKVVADHPSSAPEGIVPEVPSELDASWARRALRGLGPELREILVCREVLGWDRDTIAARLSMEPDIVVQRLSSARAAAF